MLVQEGTNNKHDILPILFLYILNNHIKKAVTKHLYNSKNFRLERNNYYSTIELNS